MNIRIITYIHSYNYGAFLQAKATYLLIKKIGFNALFLDYCNKGEIKQRRLIKYYKNFDLKTNIKANIGAVYFGYVKKELINGRNNFENSIKEFPKTVYYKSLKEIEKKEKIDLLICGSDQIWNPNICDNEIDPIYYGNMNATRNVISFASSFGSYSFDDNQLVIIKDYFKKFKYISVREEYGKKIIKNLLPNAHIEVVLDPTLCLNKEEWLANSVDEKKFKEETKVPYMLIYSVADYHKLENAINLVSKKLNLKTVWVKNDTRKNLKVDYIVNNANPNDFLWLINNAEYIVTDSFHGTIFSINFKKNFTSIINEKNPDRVLNICKKLELLDHVQKYTDKNFNTTPINYENISKKLDIMRNQSIDWLKKAIQNTFNNLKEKNSD